MVHTDGAVGRLPHLFQLVLLHACLIRGDGGTLDADIALLNRLGSFQGHFIVSLITMLKAKVKIV